MRKYKLRTVDVAAYEWFDRVNGNSYFAGRVTVNFGMRGEQTFVLPFQYGYGDHYRWKAFDLLVKNKVIPQEFGRACPWVYYDNHDIIARHTKHEGCLKRELKQITAEG